MSWMKQVVEGRQISRVLRFFEFDISTRRLTMTDLDNTCLSRLKWPINVSL